MKKHTTFRIGGPADYYLCPHSAKEIQKVVEICREEKIPYFILGNGSNLLVSDKGYRGAVIQLWKNVSDIRVDGCLIEAKAGASLAKIAAQALEEGLTGMEFAAGIPGTLGGAVVMIMPELIPVSPDENTLPPQIQYLRIPVRLRWSTLHALHPRKSWHPGYLQTSHWLQMQK